MTTQHTPGPWERDGEYVQQAGQTEVGICSVLNMDEGGNKGWYHGPVTQANARLIAAAPELLEALEPFVKRSCSDETITLVLKTADVARARAAIAKAKGEQQ